MFNTIKNKLISVIGMKVYRKAVTGIMRLLFGVHKKVMCSDAVVEVKSYQVKGKHSFFGYYDLQSLNSEKSKLLSLVVDDRNQADIGYFDVESSDFHKISDTHAWNYQMGSRLRWFKDDNHIIFNDYDDKGDMFISRIVDLAGIECDRLPFPLYDIDVDMKYGYYTDFTILNYLREGYGYSNKNAKFDNYFRDVENGIFKADVDKKTSKLLLSINDIKKISYSKDMDNKYHYINHISVNPYSEAIMFLHIWTDGAKDVASKTYNRMIFINSKGNILNIICEFDVASHYAWQDKNHILVYCYDKKKIQCRLYNYLTGEYQVINGISTDGHPSFIKNDYIITDTYSNHYSMENLYISNIKKDRHYHLFSIFHNPGKVGAFRCDLHPRWKDGWINLDAQMDDYRKQYIIRINSNVQKWEGWKSKILLDSNNCFSSRGSMLKCMISEYLFMTGRKKVNFMKMIGNWFINPTYRVNVWISKMQACHNIIIKSIIRNHLEVKYSVLICGKAKIGKHFRVDHFFDIVIAPETIIGDYCKVYQNVTIGKKNGRCPRIGNNVTIYPGAKVIGGITIGNNSIIGANAVVVNDVPANSTVAGVPAKIIK